MNKPRFIFVIVVLLVSVILASSAPALVPIRTVFCTVTKVSDGDTVTVLTAEQTKLKVRLYGIDAPETERINHRTGIVSKSGQPFGEEAQSYLASLILHRSVRLDRLDIDRYRRMVSIVWLGNTNINLGMIRVGMAEGCVEYLRDPRYRHEFLQVEQEARAKRIGIWS